jgi:hypothetical protein
MKVNIGELQDVFEKHFSQLENSFTDRNYDFEVKYQIGEGFSSPLYSHYFNLEPEPIIQQKSPETLDLWGSFHFHLNPKHFEKPDSPRCRFFLNDIPEEERKDQRNITHYGPGVVFVKGGSKKSIYVPKYDYKRVHKGISFSVCLLLQTLGVNQSDVWNIIEPCVSDFIKKVNDLKGDNTDTKVVRRVCLEDRKGKVFFLFKIVNLDKKTSKR